MTPVAESIEYTLSVKSCPFHIVIDGVCLGRRKTGNETYIRGLLEGLASRAGDWSIGNRAVKFSILTTSAHTGARQECFEWIDIPLGNLASRNLVTIPRLLSRIRPDVYHGVYWIRWWAPSCATLLTVHDLSFVSFPQGFKPHERWVYANIIRLCAHAADHLTTISHFSKKELMEHWQLPDEKVTVTYLGTDARFHPGTNGGATSEPYLLAVGNLHPRKNLRRLIEAFVLLKQRHAIPHKLRIVGQKAWLFDDVFESVRRHGMENDIVFTGYLADSEVVETYQRADVTIYPSLYEGFGFPPLEAMASGCPVVCSTAASIPEVAGDAAVMVDPTSVEAIAEGIHRLLRDDNLRETFIKRGLVQAQRFSWSQCAAETVEAYAKVIASRQEKSAL